MWVVWDIFAIVLIILFVNLGAKRGFVRTLILVLSYVIAAFLGRMLSPVIARWMYTNFLEQSFVNAITDKLTEILRQGATTGTQIIESLPGWMAGLLLAAFPDLREMSMDGLLNAQRDGLTANARDMVKSLLEQPVTEFLSWMLFIVLFLVLVIAIRLVARIFTGVNHLPVLGTLNMVAGGLFGALQALVLLLVLAVCLQAAGVFLGSKLFVFDPEGIRSSYIMGNLYRWLFGS